MSTRFGVETKSLLYDNETVVVIVAVRHEQMSWANNLAQLLPDNLEVIAIDNTAQGVNTIGDIRKIINEQN